MPRIFTHRPSKVAIFGNSGYGKSQYQIRATLASRARYKFVFDHKREFETLANAESVAWPAEIDAAFESGWIVFNPHRMFPGRLSEGFDFFCDYVWQASEAMPGTKLIVADELALLTEGSKPMPLCRVLEDGRSVALDVIMTSHGANSLHNRIRSQFTEVVTFYQNSKPALDILRDEFGFNPDLIAGKEVNGQRTGGLERGEYIARSEAGRFQGGKVF
jgi:hypothetical protein